MNHTRNERVGEKKKEKGVGGQKDKSELKGSKTNSTKTTALKG